MIVAINFANERYKNAQKLNTKTAKKYGADIVYEYSFKDLPTDFVNKHKDHFKNERGCGLWIWKPFIICETLKKINDGDYLIYTDSGSRYVDKIEKLIEAMNNENTDIMCFQTTNPEKYWSKRDALILMYCDKEEVINTFQICGTYLIIKKSDRSEKFIKQWIEYCGDYRIVSDENNVMGMENYPEFIENRHDQTVLSLLCKVHNIKPFRDPSQYGLVKDTYDDDVILRSTYEQVIDSHRDGNADKVYKLSKWYRLCKSAKKSIKTILKNKNS